MIRAAAVFLALTAALPGAAETVTPATGAILRGLDKVNGETTDIDLLNGGKAQFGDLEVTLGDCRYPVDNPAGNAYAFVQIRDLDDGRQWFEGWMMAAAPALNALDHARYDIWVLRCKTPATE